LTAAERDSASPVGRRTFLSITHVVAIAMSLVMPVGCQAWTWTPEERASHEAYEKGFAACDKLKDFMDRKHCFDDLPEDLTQIDPDEIVGVSLTGIDHLADHLSVQDFYVDGTPGAQAGTGGSLLCCAKLPRVWRPGLTVEVRWNVTNWRDCTGEDFVKRVPVERYDQLGGMGCISSRTGTFASCRQTGTRLAIPTQGIQSRTQYRKKNLGRSIHWT
jgi:hypothetical protein